MLKSSFEFYRNLLVLSFSFLFAFTGFSGAQNLESSLNLGDVNGTLSLGLIYLFLTLSSVISPAIVELFPAKYCVNIQLVIMGAFVLSNIYPRVWLAYPAAVLLGCGAGPLWVAQGYLVTQFAGEHAMRNELETKQVSGDFNGTFYAIFQFSQVSGNLLSSLILNQSSDPKHPSTDLKTLLFVVYLAIMSAGLLLSLFLPNKRKQSNSYSPLDIGSENPQKTMGELLSQFFNFLANPVYIFLIPLTLANGLEMGFAFSDITRDVVKANIGESQVGYAMVCFGISNTIFSLTLGKLIDRIGTTPVIVFGALVQIIVAVFLMSKWDDYHWTETQLYLWCFGVSAAWGIGDATWNTVLSAINTSWFEEDSSAAFANFKFWQSLGATAAFLYDSRLSFHVRCMIVIVALITGVIGYLVSYCIRKRKASNE